MTVPSNPIAARIYEELAPVAAEDANHGYILLRFIEAWTESMVEIDNLVRDSEGNPGWSSLFDVSNVADKFLDFVSQFLGIEFAGGETATQKRDLMETLANLRRGHPDAIKEWVGRYLTVYNFVARNEITNPNAQGSATPPATISGWSPRGQCNDDFQQVTVDGAPAFRLIRDTDGSGQQDIYMRSAPAVSVTAGQYVAAAAMVRRTGASSRTALVSLIGNGAPATIKNGGSVTLTTAYQRLTAEATVVPAGHTACEMRVNVQQAAEGETFYARECIFCIADTAAEADAGIANYFDGSEGADSNERVMWDGTPHGSSSYKEIYDPDTPGYIIFNERSNGSAYHYSVRTLTSETPDPDLVLKVLTDQKPAGLIMDYATMTGMTYDTINAAYDTYTDSYVDRATYTEWGTELP